MANPTGTIKGLTRVGRFFSEVSFRHFDTSASVKAILHSLFVGWFSKDSIEKAIGRLDSREVIVSNLLALLFFTLFGFIQITTANSLPNKFDIIYLIS